MVGCLLRPRGPATHSQVRAQVRATFSGTGVAVGQGGGRRAVHVEGTGHVGHRDASRGIGRPERVVQPGDDVETLCGERFPDGAVEGRHQIRVVVADPDEVDLGPARHAERRQNLGELGPDIRQAEVDASFVDLVMPEAMDQVVEADVDRHQNRRGVLAQEGHGEGELRCDGMAAVAALEHGRGGLTRTAQLHQLEVTPSGAFGVHQVVCVPLVGGRALRDGRRGLKADRVRPTEGEVVVRSHFGGLNRGGEAENAGGQRHDDSGRSSDPPQKSMHRQRRPRPPSHPFPA